VSAFPSFTMPVVEMFNGGLHPVEWEPTLIAKFATPSDFYDFHAAEGETPHRGSKLTLRAFEHFLPILSAEYVSVSGEDSLRLTFATDDEAVWFKLKYA
jgi:hypothetical protein